MSRQLATAHASYPLSMPDGLSNPVCARIELQSAHQEPQLNVSRKRKRSLKIFTDAKLCVKQQGLHGRRGAGATRGNKLEFHTRHRCLRVCSHARLRVEVSASCWLGGMRKRESLR